MNIIIYLIHLKYTVFYIIYKRGVGWVVRNMNLVYFLYYNTFILNIFYIRRGEGSPWHREEAAKGQGCGGHQRGDGGQGVQTYVRHHEGGGGG